MRGLRTLFFPARARRIAIAALSAVVSATALSDPPPWAPAHGWRKKHDPHYVGYTGGNWDRDFGVLDGRCNRSAIGAVIGGAAGAAIGSQIGKGTGRTVATIIGAVVGAAIGAEVGRDMDKADQACVAHALELARNGQHVSWRNDTTGVAYTLTPLRGYRDVGQECREFSLTRTYDGARRSEKRRACEIAPGMWEMASR